MDQGGGPLHVFLLLVLLLLDDLLLEAPAAASAALRLLLRRRRADRGLDDLSVGAVDARLLLAALLFAFQADAGRLGPLVAANGGHALLQRLLEGRYPIRRAASSCG